MRFKNTYKFSPISNGEEAPFEFDLFHHSNNEVPESEVNYNKYIEKHNVMTDDFWWIEQRRRCIDGVTYSNVLEKGGDAIVDGIDAIWNDAKEPMEYFNRNVERQVIIPPTSVYIVDADLICKDYKLHIPGRLYFYLNFWKIMRKVKGQKRKKYGNPKFTDMDFFKAYRVVNQIKEGVDNSEAKARQKGFSEWVGGGILAYNYLFVHDSENIIIAGTEGDATNLFAKTMNGIDNLKNTQFYRFYSKKVQSKDDMKLIAERGGSIQSFYTSTDPQKLSRLSPYWVVYEEVGKWQKGLVKQVDTFVTPSIIAENERTGFRTYIGTGGEMDKGADDLRKIHYSTSNQYLRFVNKFERVDATNTKSGWFTSDWWFKVIDEDGNSLKAESIVANAKEISDEKDAVERYILTTQKALFAGDAFMISNAGFFGEVTINRLNARLAKIRLNKELQIERHGILEWIDKSKPYNGVRFIETDKEEAFVTIVEEPMLDKDGKAYFNLYEGGIDSYDQDESNTSTSLGAAVIRKKLLDLNTTYNTDCAMLLERPDTAHGGRVKFYEHCAMLGIYYGKLEFTIEHTRKLVIDWMLWNGFESLIAERPSFAFADKIDKSKAANRYGVDGSMKPQVMALMSETLTEEFIDNMFLTEQIEALAKYQYSRSYNCDVTVATAHANIGAKEHSNRIIMTEDRRNNERAFKPRVFKRVSNNIIAI